jgi:hypothetical protein
MIGLSNNNNSEAAMKQKILVVLLSIEALACVLFCILQTSFTAAFSAVMAFPFEQIGMGLRSLSLSSGLGNAVAIVVYFAASLLPITAALILRKKRRLCAEDGLLVLLSAVLFAVLYIMINPGVISTWTGGVAAQSIGKAILGGMAYSVLCGYFVLRILRLFFNGATEKLVCYMSVMFHLLTVLFVYLIFGAGFNGLLNSITALQAGNVGNEHLLGASYFFLVLQFVVDTLPYAFNVLVVFAALRLLDEMRADRYSAETVAVARKISRICAASLVAMVLANVGFNLLQLLFAKSLTVINSSVQIPVFSITFVLAALLLTRLVTENKQLKDDNDMFI